MQRFVQRTWKPTVAFVILSWVIAGLAMGNRFMVALPALLLTPLVWWVMVARRDQPLPRHGAIAGALAVLAAQIVPLTIASLWFGSVRPYGSDDLQSVTDQMAAMQVVGAIVGTALGSVIGSLLARGRFPTTS